VALTPEEKRRFLKALEEDEEFRMAVAGTIGLGGILEELKRLREDFEKWIKIEKERWEAADKRFARIETTLGAIAEAQFSRYVWEELREEGRGEAVLRRERNVDLDGVDIDLLVETDRHVYVVEVKTRPKIADVGALLAKCDVAQQKLGKPAIPILTGVMIGREVEAYARGKGVRIMKF
jgi:Holliday junction resolvase-like predicted endonuclease